MEQNSKIFLAGSAGLVGSAVLRRLKKDGYSNVLSPVRAQLDLTNETAVARFMGAERPDYVFICAAKVGGILANLNYPAEFIHRNLAIQINIIHNSYLHGVKRLLFLGSNCIYPRETPQPIREDYMLTGPLEWTNRPYAVAKIAGVEMCWAYNRQYSTSYLTLMPVNLYGPGDNFDPETSHVIAAILRKVHEAKVYKRAAVRLWGTGNPRREFMHSDDVADAAMTVMNLPDDLCRGLLTSNLPPILNVGTGGDMPIRDIAQVVMEIIGYEGSIEWDTSKPDGTMRKLLDNGRMRALGWMPKIPLKQGLQSFYHDFLATERAVSAP